MFCLVQARFTIKLIKLKQGLKLMNSQDKQFWNRLAIKYDNNSVREVKLCDYYSYNYFFILPNRWWGELKNKNILITDLFNERLGLNEHLKSIIKNGNTVVGIDVSCIVTRMAKKNCQQYGVTFVTADVRDLPFEPEVFDFIISPSTVDHFPKSQISSTLKGLRCVLKKDGRMIICVHNRHNLFLRLFPIKWDFPAEFYSVKEFKRALENSGFKILNITAINHVLHPRALKKITDWIVSGSKRKFKKNPKYRFYWLNLLEHFITKYFTGLHISFNVKKVND